jgi:hypothetical protein
MMHGGNLKFPYSVFVGQNCPQFGQVWQQFLTTLGQQKTLRGDQQMLKFYCNAATEIRCYNPSC